MKWFPEKVFRIDVRLVPGVLFLLAQAFRVGFGLFEDTKNFCWSPHTVQISTDYEIRIRGRLLSPQDVIERYHLFQSQWESHSIHNVITWIEQYERTYGVADSAQIRLTYHINGGPAQWWTHVP